MTYFIDQTDKRNFFVQKYLEEKGCKTSTYEKKSPIKSGDKLIFAPNKKFDDKFVKNLPVSVSVFCGNVSENIQKLFFEKNITHKNFLDDEIFAIQNAKLTAEGILALIIYYSEKSMFENNILIFGSGRVGKATALLFEKLGLKYSIVSHTNSTFEKNHLFNCKNYFAREFKTDLNKFDIIINTIPAKILTDDDLQKIDKNCLFLEIASLQTIDTDKLNFTYMLCPALPQKYSAETAGKVMFDCLMRIDK